MHDTVYPDTCWNQHGFSTKASLTQCCWLTGLTWAYNTVSSAGVGGSGLLYPPQRQAASAPVQLFAKTRLIMLLFLAPICTTYRNGDFLEAEEEVFGLQTMTADDTYRSRGVPWLLLLWVVTGDHNATACLRNPELLDSPDVGSHCEQSAPIAYGSVCRKSHPNQARQRTSMPKFTFLKSKNCDRCPSPRGAAAWCGSNRAVLHQSTKQYTVSPRGGTATTAPDSTRTQIHNGSMGLKSQLLLFSYAPNISMCHTK